MRLSRRDICGDVVSPSSTAQGGSGQDDEHDPPVRAQCGCRTLTGAEAFKLEGMDPYSIAANDFWPGVLTFKVRRVRLSPMSMKPASNCGADPLLGLVAWVAGGFGARRAKATELAEQVEPEPRAGCERDDRDQEADED